MVILVFGRFGLKAASKQTVEGSNPSAITLYFHMNPKSPNYQRFRAFSFSLPLFASKRKQGDW